MENEKTTLSNEELFAVYMDLLRAKSLSEVISYISDIDNINAHVPNLADVLGTILDRSSEKLQKVCG